MSKTLTLYRSADTRCWYPSWLAAFDISALTPDRSCEVPVITYPSLPALCAEKGMMPGDLFRMDKLHPLGILMYPLLQPGEEEPECVYCFPLRDPRKCSHPTGHYVDNQGYCHCCGVPLNLDYLGVWLGDYAEALEILRAYEKECSDYVSTLEETK